MTVCPQYGHSSASLPGGPEHTPAIRATRVTKQYFKDDAVVHALDGVSIDVAEGEYLSIMGPSGSGKSTFFNMIGGLDTPTSGEVYIHGVNIAKLDSARLADLRCRKIGYIFQTFNLVPAMTALENCSLPGLFAGRSRREAETRAREVLEEVGLADRIRHYPLELSGGQQQRVAIARSLVNAPAILLADEPTGNLDSATGREIISLLRTLNREKGVTVISATHDLHMIEHSDRIVWIRDGRVEKVERRDEIESKAGTFEDHEE